MGGEAGARRGAGVRLLGLAWVVAAAPGCFKDVEMDDASAGSSSAASLATLSAGETTTSTGGTTGAALCAIDSQCPQGYVCVDGACEFDPSNCGEFGVSVPVLASNVVLVLDKSGSMVSNSWDHDADPETAFVTRWRSLYEVVEQLVAGFDLSLRLGAVLFPRIDATGEYNVNACLVDDAPLVAVGANNGAAVLAALPGPGSVAEIKGGTPAARGIAVAFEHLLGIQDGLPRVMVLVTDGAANCRSDAMGEYERFESYDDSLLPLVAEAYAAGIPTFVVGIDIADEVSPNVQDGNPNGVNTYAKLNELADAGGVPRADPAERFYNAGNQIELNAALTAIAGAVVSCTIVLDPAPTFPSYVELNVGGVDFGGALAGECAGQDGWRYVDAEKTTIELCGQACALFQQSGALNAFYRCPPSG